MCIFSEMERANKVCVVIVLVLKKVRRHIQSAPFYLEFKFS
jgi:hypothetical protein